MNHIQKLDSTPAETPQQQANEIELYSDSCPEPRAIEPQPVVQFPQPPNAGLLDIGFWLTLPE